MKGTTRDLITISGRRIAARTTGRGRARALGSLAALAAGTLVLAGGAGASAPATSSQAPRQAAAGAPAPQPSSASAQPRSAAATRVLLPTGDVITADLSRPGAPVLGTTAPISGGGAVTARVGEHSYIFPRSILSQVGEKFDPALFDVAAAASSERRRVTVTYVSASAPTAVPGIEITERRGVSATGWITPKSAARLRAGLAARPATALYAGVVRISPAATAPASSPARWPMFTVSVRGTDATGGALDSALILSVDDAAKGGTFVPFRNGSAKVSVPQGTYILMASGFAPDGAGLVTMTEPFAVRAHTRATVDLRDATTPLTFAINAPVDYQSHAADVAHTVTTGSVTSGASMGFLGDDRLRLRVSPTSGATPGLTTRNSWMLAYSRAGQQAGRYAVTTSRAGPLPRRAETDIVQPGSLSRITSVVYGPSAPEAVFERTVLDREIGGWTFGTLVPAPGRITEYLSSATNLMTHAFLSAAFDPTTWEERGRVESEWRPLPTPTRFTEEWLRAPLASFIFSEPRFFAPSAPVCFACVSGRQLALNIFRGDSYPWHIVYADRTDGRPDVTWSISADGKRVASGADYLITTDAPVTLPAGTQRLGVLVTSKRGAPFATSTRLTSQWSVPLTTDRLPAGWQCPLTGACRVLPLPTLDYRLPVELDGSLAEGRRQLRLQVRQVARARPVGITAVRLESAHGGDWEQIPVQAKGSGVYVAMLNVPRRNAGVTVGDLRVTVTGRDGSRYVETTEAAYLLR